MTDQSVVKETSLISEASGPVIMVRGLTKTYRTGKVPYTALHEIDLDIERGEFTAIMGPSGSGKSTLMNILGCLDHMDSGQYILNGTPVTEMTENDLALIRNEEIGFVFQSFNLLPKLNLLDNVALPMVYAGIKRQERLERAREALLSVDLIRWAAHRPYEISSVQQQRVAIARAMVMRPSLLLADEPTGNLDSRAANEIMNIFDRLNKESTTIVVITHEINIAKWAQRIIHIVDGRLVQDTFGRNASPHPEQKTSFDSAEQAEMQG